MSEKKVSLSINFQPFSDTIKYKPARALPTFSNLQIHAVEAGNRITSAWKLIYLLQHAHITKTTTNDCSGTMGKSKQVDIFAPCCSAVQLGRKDKPWTGVAEAFVEHQHLFIICSHVTHLSPVGSPPHAHTFVFFEEYSGQTKCIKPWAVSLGSVLSKSPYRRVPTRNMKLQVRLYCDYLFLPFPCPEHLPLHLLPPLLSPPLPSHSSSCSLSCSF
jgi:hypothetical protein